MFYPQNYKIRQRGIMKSCRYSIRFFVLIALLPLASAIADELMEGVWHGTFVNTLDKRYKIKYNVSYKDEDDIRTLHIEMINLDLEPMPEFTYQLTDIEVKAGEISFKIPQEHDIKECVLKNQEDGNYGGECLSNKAVDGETSQITMIADPDMVSDSSDE